MHPDCHRKMLHNEIDKFCKDPQRKPKFDVKRCECELAVWDCISYSSSIA